MLMAVCLIAPLVPVLAAAAEETESNDVAAKAALLTQPRERPYMFVTASRVEGLRSVADVRRGITSGHAKYLWEKLLDKVNRELAEPVVTPMQERDGQRVLGNRPYSLVAQAANRILDTALVALVLEDQRYIDGALQQIMALFDEDQWPEWSDQAHLNAGLNADLRHGQLVVPAAVAYDWLYHQLTPEQRSAIVDGLDRCAITPYKAGYAAGEHWSRRQTNWMTVVLGGFGIAGMALGPDHPDSALLVANSLPEMERYLDVLGPEGEFNESVQYAGSMAYLVRYFMAMRYASGGADNPFARHSFSKFYEWYMLMTFPPGRVAGFGDPAPNMPPVVVPVAAVAAATRNPVLQWFYEQYNDKMLESHRKRALEVLYYDAGLDAQSPQGRMPLGKAFHYQGKLVSSRSDWDPISTTSVVYAKAGREANHGHADWGQLCVDGYGERLVVDLGAPPGYPKSGSEYFYNYQQFGHNVFVFGENDTGGVSLREKGRSGVFLWTEFDEQRGAAWSMDLSGVYGDGFQVTRTVVHLLPRVAAILDVATLPAKQPISMRWHLAEAVAPEPNGVLTVGRGAARLTGRILRLDGEARLSANTHAYSAPYNKDRLGNELKQKHEPYVELQTNDERCSVLTLFAVSDTNDDAVVWTDAPDGWSITTLEGEVNVEATAEALVVHGPNERVWKAPVAKEVAGAY